MPASGLLRRLAASTALTAAVLVLIPAAGGASSQAASTCSLGPGGEIKHVVNIVFDNVHLRRDRADVPSDLEQMPNLLRFMNDNGTLLAGMHTGLVSHTAPDILTTLTGLYGDRHGMPIGNSFRTYGADGGTSSHSSFGYWTAKNAAGQPLMVDPYGKNPPAPWVPFTRAGCDVGAAGAANIVLENVKQDVTTVYGSGSPEAQQAASDPELATTDLVGVAVHCTQAPGNLCTRSTSARPDLLPDESGGYVGFKGLFGHRPVAAALGRPVTDINGRPVVDPKGRPGFPGFDGMTASVSLGYTAAMLEAGIPITYAYISTAHESHRDGHPMGPGEALYVEQLREYDTAFGVFFDRLRRDRIDRTNTLFVISSDEGDHFAGGAGAPEGCDGVVQPCTYSKIGQVTVNMTGLLATQAGFTSAFTMRNDTAGVFYLAGQPGAGDPATRALERAVAGTTAINPYTDQTVHTTTRLAGTTELQILHMLTGDPSRTPTLVAFAQPDFTLVAGAPNCSAPCVRINPKAAWQHGAHYRQETTTWAGLVGPTIQHLGTNRTLWADQTDIRPTVMLATHLHDSYLHQGRALVEIVTDNALSEEAREYTEEVIELGEIYKRLNAPVGEFGLSSLGVATRAIAAADPGDATFKHLDSELLSLGAERDVLVAAMNGLLARNNFGDGVFDEDWADLLSERAEALLERLAQLAERYPPAEAGSPDGD